MNSRQAIVFLFLSGLLTACNHAVTPPAPPAGSAPSTSPAVPALSFSDITGGPASGLNDGLGTGALVTIWGHNLGSSQGASKVYLGSTEVSQVYYWKNADGTLPGGPADLFTYGKMQEIAFSVPATVPVGATGITVAVNGVSSNSLPFTVRNGNIYHVMTSGSATGTGSWSNPWLSLKNGAITHIGPGDIVYVHDGVQDVETSGSLAANTSTGILLSGLSGTNSLPIAIVTYPNSRALAQGYNLGVDCYQSTGIIVSKYLIKAGDVTAPNPTDPTVLPAKTGLGIKTTANGRVIGNEITTISGQCVSGMSGAIASGAGGGTFDYESNAKIYGNYVHDWGCNQTSKFEHTTYISIRNTGVSNVAPVELAWNTLLNNKAKYGLHFYDETYTSSNSACGNFTGVVTVHDNFVVNQKGPGINVGAKAPDGYVCWTGNFDFYNNTLVHTGLGPSDEVQAELAAVRIGDAGMSGTVRLYNNTVYGFGDNTLNASYKTAFAFYQTNNSGRVTVDISDNLIQSLNGYGYFSIDLSTYSHVSGQNNLWYGASAGMGSIPANISASLFADPLLNTDYGLLPASPAIDAGTPGIAAHDIRSTPRPRGSAWDIGAFEF